MNIAENGSNARPLDCLCKVILEENHILEEKSVQRYLADTATEGKAVQSG